MVAGQALRVGIISANWGARAHLPAWRTLDGIEVTAICTSRRETAETAATRHGVSRPFWDFRALAADPDIDIIDVGSRPPLRHDMVLAALSAGKHVYNGIPFAACMADSRRMLDAWRAAGTVAAVDAFIQATPALARLKELIDEGAIGEVFGARCSLDVALFTETRTNAPGYVWFADRANGASAMRNNGSHMIHLLVHLFGPVEAIVSDQSLRLPRWPRADGTTIEPEVADTSASILRFASGLSVEVSTCWSMVDAPGFRFEVWGARGRLEASSPNFPQSFNTRLFAGKIGGFERTTVEVEIPERLKVLPGSTAHGDAAAPGLFPMARAFASMRAAIRGEAAAAAPDFAQAHHVQQVVEAAERASDERRWVRIDEV